MVLSDEFLDESYFWSPSSRKIAAQEIRSLRDQLGKVEAYVVLTKTLHNKAVDERDEAYRQRDEARAAYVGLLSDHEFIWNSEGGKCKCGWSTRNWQTAWKEWTNHVPNPGQPFLARLAALERVRAALIEYGTSHGWIKDVAWNKVKEALAAVPEEEHVTSKR